MADSAGSTKKTRSVRLASNQDNDDPDCEEWSFTWSHPPEVPSDDEGQGDKAEDEEANREGVTNDPEAASSEGILRMLPASNVRVQERKKVHEAFGGDGEEPEESKPVPSADMSNDDDDDHHHHQHHDHHHLRTTATDPWEAQQGSDETLPVDNENETVLHEPVEACDAEEHSETEQDEDPYTKVQSFRKHGKDKCSNSKELVEVADDWQMDEGRPAEGSGGTPAHGHVAGEGQEELASAPCGFVDPDEHEDEEDSEEEEEEGKPLLRDHERTNTHPKPDMQVQPLSSMPWPWQQQHQPLASSAEPVLPHEEAAAEHSSDQADIDQTAVAAAAADAALSAAAAASAAATAASAAASAASAAATLTGQSNESDHQITSPRGAASATPPSSQPPLYEENLFAHSGRIALKDEPGVLRGPRLGGRQPVGGSGGGGGERRVRAKSPAESFEASLSAPSSPSGSPRPTSASPRSASVTRKRVNIEPEFLTLASVGELVGPTKTGSSSLNYGPRRSTASVLSMTDLASELPAEAVVAEVPMSIAPRVVLRAESSPAAKATPSSSYDQDGCPPSPAPSPITLASPMPSTSRSPVYSPSPLAIGEVIAALADRRAVLDVDSSPPLPDRFFTSTSGGQPEKLCRRSTDDYVFLDDGEDRPLSGAGSRRVGFDMTPGKSAGGESGSQEAEGDTLSRVESENEEVPSEHMSLPCTRRMDKTAGTTPGARKLQASGGEGDFRMEVSVQDKAERSESSAAAAAADVEIISMDLARTSGGDSMRTAISRRVTTWAEDVSSGFQHAWNQVADGTRDALAALIDMTDEAGVWAQERIEEEYSKVVVNAGLRREVIKARMFDYTAGVRSNIIGGFKDLIKNACLSDPDMWPWVKAAYRDTLDKVLNDIEHEIEVGLEAALLKQQSSFVAEGPKGHHLWSKLYLRLRAFVLYHYLPFDLSIFGKLKDPVYWAFLLLTTLPVHFLRLIFFTILLGFLLYPGPPDEFQLINFILMTKGSQFVSAGLFMMARGAMMYFACFSCCKPTMAECIMVYGPGSVDSLVLSSVDYLGAITLPWIAFRWLPYSEKAINRTYVGRKMDELEDDMEDEESPQPAMGPTKSQALKRTASRILVFQGGRLRRLLIWDMKCFGFSLVVLLLLAISTWREDETQEQNFFSWVWHSAQFKEDLFWAKVLYGILSLPFLPFMISLFLKVLTHCEYTGFNEHGACVAFDMPLKSRFEPRFQKRRRTVFTHLATSVGLRPRHSTGSSNRGSVAVTPRNNRQTVLYVPPQALLVDPDEGRGLGLDA